MRQWQSGTQWNEISSYVSMMKNIRGRNMDNDVEIQAQDTTGNWRTYHITNINNSQVVLIEMRSLKRRYPDSRVRAVDRSGRLIDLLD
jgi:lipoate synthase